MVFFPTKIKWYHWLWFGPMLFGAYAILKVAGWFGIDLINKKE